MKIFCAVKDLAVQAFGTPFLVNTRQEAVRSFKDEVNRIDGKSAVANHPEDYELYEIAQYNEQTGEVASNETDPELIVRAKDLLTREQQ